MDEKLLLLINREWTNSVLDRVMAAASSFDAWGPIILVVVVWLLIRGGFKMRAFVLTAAAIVGINDGVIAKSLKRIVDRPRPHQVLQDVRQVDLAKGKPRMIALFKPLQIKMSQPNFQEDVEGRSFPSSHTINTLSAALVAMAFFGARAAWGLLIAGLVAYSRVYTGSHWPSDVITSIFLGIGTTLVLLSGIEWLWRRYGARWFPKIHAVHPKLALK